MSEEAEQIPQDVEQDYPIQQPPTQEEYQQPAQEESMETGVPLGDHGVMGGNGDVGMGVTGATGDTEMGGEGMAGDGMAGDGGYSEGAAVAAGNQQTEEEEPNENCKLFVGGLSWETNESALKEYFKTFGEVQKAEVKMDRETGKSRGFAFVNFTDEATVTKVLDTTGHNLDGRTVDVKRAIPHAQHQAMKNRTKKIFVGGVPIDMSEQTLKDYFETFGKIEEVALVTDKTDERRRRGFVFVTFFSEESVDDCTEKTFHKIQDSRVEVKRATPRDQGQGGQRAGGKGGGGGGGGWRGGGRPRGGGGGGGGGGNFGRGGWMPYGQYGGYGHYGGGYGGGGGGGGGGGYGAGQYGGYGYDQYGGGYGGYGGQGGGQPQGGGRGGGLSRYGPVKNYNQHGGQSYHPYSR